MATGRSTVGSKLIFKNSKDGVTLKGIYRISITNNSLLTVNINDTEIGTIPISPGSSPTIIEAHPDYPFDVQMTIQFNELAPATDNILIIYTRTYGERKN